MHLLPGIPFAQHSVYFHYSPIPCLIALHHNSILFSTIFSQLLSHSILMDWISYILTVLSIPLSAYPHLINEPTLNIGDRTALPASPYWNAVSSCGSILCVQTPSGKLSNWPLKLEKNLLFSTLSFIWISSRNSKVSTKSFLK